MTAITMSRGAAADVLDQVHSNYDMALKAAGRRVVELRNESDAAKIALTAFQNTWNTARLHLEAIHGKLFVDAALKALNLPHVVI
jgi:hypothetical protein